MTHIISLFKLIFSLSSAEELLLAYINSKLEEGDTWVFIGQTEVSKEIDKSRQTISKAISGLIDKKLLFWTGYRGKYFVNRNFLPITNNFQVNYFYGQQ